MPMESSVNDVFRFVQLRPRRPLEESAPIPLQDDTSLAQSLLEETSPAGRASTANAALKNGRETVGGLSDLPFGAEIVAALAGLREVPDSTTDDLVQKVPELSNLYSDSTAGERYLALSNTLFASLYATEYFPRDLAALPDVYRIYHLFLQKDAREAQSLASLLGRPLLAPAPERSGEKTPPSGPAAGSSPDADAAKLTKAMQEIGKLDRHEHLVQPTAEGLPAQGTLPFTLTANARQRLSAATQDVLVKRGLDLAVLHPEVAVQALGAELGYLADTLVEWPAPVVTTQPGVTLPPPPTLSLVKPAGLADLLVVKQQIKRYEAGEIAHVENLLAGEKKSRAHRRLERSEETFSSDTEVTREQQTELETADRFELSRETSRTIEEDRETSLGLSLSGKYGPTVEFSSNFTLDSSTSSEESTKSSSRYARDVVSRSLERITERAREKRSRTVIRETEETNLHELHNETGEPIRGVYQFLDKVYEAQIFNYGVREMFDFMVPEPASFLWHMEQNPSLDLQLPPAPPDLHAVAPSAAHITEQNALALAAAFGATDIEAPPPLYKVLTVGIKHGEDNASEEGHPKSGLRVEAQVPPGYRPLRARIRGLALTDDQPVVAIVIGGQRVVWNPATASGVDLGEDHRLHHQPELFLSLAQEPYELTADSKLGVAVVAWETNTFSLDVVIVLQRTAEELGRWRLATYKKIRAAYDDAVRRHEQKVAELRAEAEARMERETRRPFGAPPAENTRTIVAELKKHCLSLLTEQRYDAFDALKPGTPPWFDFQEAAAEGGYIRFFEQAFEWDQMQYVFYPYFWARKTSWAERFAKQDVDPRFLEFLKAGAARVVVPVRPGFEVAVTHFLETGRIWGGEGEPPPIHSPLYLSIIDEIRERTGAPQGEIAVDDPWEVRVPTALVLVRAPSDGPDLPRWERVAPGEWSWRPVPGA